MGAIIIMMTICIAVCYVSKIDTKAIYDMMDLCLST